VHSFQLQNLFMRLYIKYDIHAACRKILEEKLQKMDLQYSFFGNGEIELSDIASEEVLTKLNFELNNYSIQIVENHKNILIQKIKDIIKEMVYSDDKLTGFKNSVYLAEKLNLSYTYISSLFSEMTFTSIENYIILQRIERAKQLIVEDELTISQISYKLNYSSVPHLSTQFKNVTGLTPSSFQRIISKRRLLQEA